jgi:hypothetical protein
VFNHVSILIRTWGKHHCVCVGFSVGNQRVNQTQGGKFGMILHGSSTEGRGSTSFVVSKPRTSSFLSVGEKRGTFYSHVTEKKRQANANA